MRERATLVFVGYLLAMAIVCGAVIVSGWFAGVMYDPAERVFWAGAILAGLTVAVLATAAFPGWRDERREEARVRWTLRVGLIIGIIAPTLCIAAMIADFYR
jgi:MFS family permease